MKGWDACTLEPNVVMRWMECHPSVTGFAATILGLLVAAGVPLLLWRRDLSEKAKEKRLSSRAFAAALLAPIAQIKLDVPRVRHMLGVLRDTSRGNPGMPDRLRDCRFIVPNEIPAAMREMHQFDNSVVGPIRTSITGVQSYNFILDQLALAASNDVKRFDDAREALLPQLERTLTVAEEGLDRVLGPTFGGSSTTT